METAAATLKPGQRIALPEITLAHVIVIGPRWEPREVWLTDLAGNVYTLAGDARVELVA
jgi:hypothetical protein